MGGRGTSSSERYKSTGAKSADAPSGNEVADTRPDSELTFEELQARRKEEARQDKLLESFNNTLGIDQFNSLSPEEVQDWKNFTYQGDQDVNGYLREMPWYKKVYKSEAEAAAAVKRMDAAMDKSRTSQDFVVYRGGGGEFSDNLSPGDTFTDKGYASTSLSRNVALGFAEANASSSKWDSPERTLLKINVPKGTRAIHIPDHMDHWDGEIQMITHRNATFKVKSVNFHEKWNMRMLEVDLITK